MPPKVKRKLLIGQQTLNSFVKSTDENNNENSSESEKLEDQDLSDNGQTVTKKRKIQPDWFKLWPWLYEIDGMLYCKPCVDCKNDNAFVSGCKVYKTSSMSRHEKLGGHLNAVHAPKLAAGFQQAVDNSRSSQDTAVMKCISTVLWLAKENVPLAKFEKMFELFRDLDVPDLQPLKLNDRVQYESYYTGTEILNAISSVIDSDINVRIANSRFITVLADESTDLANKKRITLNARIVNQRTSVPETVFLRDIEYEDGTGIGLATVIIQELQKRDINIDRLIGFGSDGASVMSGSNKGVKGILMQRQPHLIHIHCMAHRLALCTSQAADLVPAIKHYQEWLTSVYYYFSKSGSREQELRKIQQVLDSPILKYKEIHAVRWLSVYQAVEAIYRTIDPLMSYLHERQAAKDPKSKGLLKKMATVDFIYITYLLMDVLAIVSKLCLTFQEANLDVAQAKVAVDSCLSDLESYKEGNQLFATHLENFSADVIEENGQATFKGHHHLTKLPTNLQSVKSNFINSLIFNIRKRFPQKTLVDAFFVMGMRSINLCSDAAASAFGNEEIDQILSHFGEEMTSRSTVSLPKVEKKVVKSQWNKAKNIVRSMKYPVDRFPVLWQLLTNHHYDDLEEIIKLAQIAMILPLHTADCERTFSQQNKILTKSRANLSTEHLDQLIRVRLVVKSGGTVDKEKVLELWKTMKDRKLYAKKLRL